MTTKKLLLIMIIVSIAKLTHSSDNLGFIEAWNSIDSKIMQNEINPALEKLNISIDPNKATLKWEQIELNDYISISIKKHIRNDSINGVFFEYVFFKIKNISDKKINVRWIYKLLYCFTPNPISRSFNIILEPNQTKEANISSSNEEGSSLSHFLKHSNINGNDLIGIKLNQLIIYKLDE